MKKLPFQEGLFSMPSSQSEKPQLFGSRCRNCQEAVFPQRHICPNCFCDDLERVVLSSRGILYTFTITHQGPTGFATPYASGYIDLPEGVRIYSLLTDWNSGKLQPGLEMELVLEKIGEDKERKELIGYKFRPLY
jgi:uncharacterized OB-fold protein